MLAVGIAAVLAASAAYNAGVVLQALDARTEPESCALRLSLLADLARRRRWLAGTALGIVAFPLQVLAYANAPLSIVQPGLAVGLVLVLFLGARYMEEDVKPRHYAAVAGIVVGLAIIAIAGPDHRQADRGGIAQLTVMAVLAVAIAAPYVWRRRARGAAALLTVSAGVAFAWGDIATKLFSDGVNGDRLGVAAFWLAAVIVSAVVATLTLMTAFQQAEVKRVVPGVFAVETTVPIMLAPLLLQHAGGLGGADVLPIVAGLLVVLASIAVLAGSEQVSWAMAGPEARVSAGGGTRARTRRARFRPRGRSTRTPPASAAGPSLPLGEAIAEPPRLRTQSRR
jgi:drug/metabolite transporter (DMT)-like permease